MSGPEKAARKATRKDTRPRKFRAIRAWAIVHEDTLALSTVDADLWPVYKYRYRAAEEAGRQDGYLVVPVKITCLRHKRR